MFKIEGYSITLILRTVATVQNAIAVAEVGGNNHLVAHGRLRLIKSAQWHIHHIAVTVQFISFLHLDVVVIVAFL